MRMKTIVDMAVASALSWSYGAMAHGQYGYMGTQSSYEVVTPFSPNESGPADWSQDAAHSGMGEAPYSAAAPVDHEVITPLSANESGPNDEMFRQEHPQSFRAASASSHSMANPQTPWSPSEAGLNDPNEDELAHERQVAEVEQARIAAAEWNAHLASSPQSGFGTSAGATGPVGGTAGLGLHGSNERSVDPSQQSWSDPSHHSSVSEPQSERGLRGEAMPGEFDRTSGLSAEEQSAVPVVGHDTVGILEGPTATGEYSVWNVEPLTPDADIATADTVYLAPDGSVAAFAPDLDRSDAMASSGDYSAGMTEESDSSSSL